MGTIIKIQNADFSSVALPSSIILDLDNPYKRGYLSTSGNISGDNIQNKGIFLDISSYKGKEITLTANDAAVSGTIISIRYAFIASDDIIMGDPIVYSAGTSLITKKGVESNSTIIPNDANYLYIMTLNGNNTPNDIMPKSVTIQL